MKGKINEVQSVEQESLPATSSIQTHVLRDLMPFHE